MIVLPIGLAPKTTPGEYRLNFDLSYPQGASINAGILREDSSVYYTRFDEVIHMLRAEGNGSFPFKVDIKSAFRLLPIHTQDFALLGMEFQKKNKKLKKKKICGKIFTLWFISFLCTV